MMYQVFNTQTNEPMPVLSETPYELAGPLAERIIEQKRDEHGNLLYLDQDGNETDDCGYETVVDEDENHNAVALDWHPYPPVMIDAGPLYEWREIVPTLDELKRSQKDKINAAKDAAEAASPFLYMEKPFDFDPLSRERLNVAIQLAQSLKITNVPGNTVIADWKLYDNTMTELTVDALVLMPQAFAERSAFLHEKAWGLKEDIDAATTIEQVETINW